MAEHRLTFHINGKELETLRVWMKKQQKKTAKMFPKDDIGLPVLPAYRYTFSPTGIGTAVEVMNIHTKDTVDISDYDSW